MKRLAVVFALLLMTPTAWAASPSAEQLFKQGVQLFSHGHVDAACSKFEASYKLKAEPGTLFDLAACHEKQGHHFQAHEEFSRLADQMQAAGKADKASIARKHASEAAKHSPKLRLVFPPSSNVEGIQLDGAPLATTSWKQPILVSPGSHTLVFSAEGKNSASMNTTGTNDQSTSVQVPILTEAPAEAAPAPRTAAPPPTKTPTPVKQQQRSAQAAAPSSESSGWSTKKEVGAILGGAGVIGVGVGAFFGIHALSQKSDANSACGSSNGGCATDAQTKAAKDRIHSAQTSATISTIAIGAGAAFLAAGAYLFLTGGAQQEGPVATAGVHLVPTGPGDAGVSIMGAF